MRNGVSSGMEIFEAGELEAELKRLGGAGDSSVKKLLGSGYRDVVGLVIRPKRAEYALADLGASSYSLAASDDPTASPPSVKRVVRRSDFEVLNDRTLKLVCSHWQLYEGDDEDSEPVTAPCLVYLHSNIGSRVDARRVRDHALRHRWTGSRIVLSYFIAFTGSYCTIQLMEQWRRIEEVRTKRLLLLQSAVALGGCGIWCMHFTGMTAIELRLEDGSTLEIDYELGYTALSLAFPVIGVLIALAIASSDPYFVEMQDERRKEMLASKLKTTKMNVIVKKSAVTRRIKIIALFSRPWFILLGGAFAALGVLGMHYLGMMAQRMNADMSFDMSIVAASVAIAYIACNAACWILFRVLTFMPNNEALRLGSAFIMGIAVSATHYVGMGAASYTISGEDYVGKTRFLLNGKGAAEAASNGALLVCYWLASFSVVRSARLVDQSARSSRDKSAVQNASVSRGTSYLKSISGVSRGPSNGIRRVLAGTPATAASGDSQV